MLNTKYLFVISLSLAAVFLFFLQSLLPTVWAQRIVNNHPSIKTADSRTLLSGVKLAQVVPTPTPRPSSPSDWPQVQKNPQHTGYSYETLGTNFRVAWTYPFQPDRVHPQVQAIIYRGKAFVGTEGANGQKPTLYVLDATNGQQVWKYEVGGPILNSAAADNGKVYVASMDGAVYAIYTDTDTENGHSRGELVWRQQLSNRKGFSTAPVIADNKVMIGGRDGYFYGLDPNDGSVLWRYQAGASILQTAAWNNGRAIFGSMDMYVHAVNTSDGSQAWKSQKIPAAGFNDYWPVVTGGKVIVQPVTKRAEPGISAGFPFTWFSSTTHWDWLAANGATIASGNANLVADIMNIQDTAMNNYQANPQNYTKGMYILDEASGQETQVVPHFSTQTMNGAVAPPCVTNDGQLVVPVMFIRGSWGRLDLTQGRITDLLYDGLSGNFPVESTHPNPNGSGNPDENLNVTCTNNLVLAMHIQEMNANYTGAFDLKNRRWTQIELAQGKNWQMFSNTQGGGGNPASVSNGLIYHISYHELIARTTN